MSDGLNEELFLFLLTSKVDSEHAAGWNPAWHTQS